MKQRVHKLLVSLFEEVGGRFVTDQQLEPIYDQWIQQIANVPYKDFKYEIIKMQSMKNIRAANPTFKKLFFALGEIVGANIAKIDGTYMIVPEEYNTGQFHQQQSHIKPIGPVTSEHIDKAEQYILQQMGTGDWPALRVFGASEKSDWDHLKNIAEKVESLLQPISTHFSFVSEGHFAYPIREYLKMSGSFQTAKSKILDPSLHNQEFNINGSYYEGEAIDGDTVNDDIIYEVVGAWEEAQTDYWEEYLEIEGLSQTDFPFKGMKYVDGLSLDSTELANLGTLQFVRWSVDIDNTPNLKTLAPIAYIEEGLTVSGKSGLQTLGVVVSIGKSIDVKNIQSFKSLGILKQVGGDIDAADTALEDLGQVKHIPGSLDCERTNLRDLGQLETVKGYVNLSDTRYLETLGQLESVGQSLDLENSAVRDIGTLHTVGGDVVITGTSLTPQAFANVKIGGEIIQ